MAHGEPAVLIQWINCPFHLFCKSLPCRTSILSNSSLLWCIERYITVHSFGCCEPHQPLRNILLCRYTIYIENAVQLSKKNAANYQVTSSHTHPHVEFSALIAWFDLEDVIGTRIATCCLHLKDVRRHRPSRHHVHVSIEDGEWLISATRVFSRTHAATEVDKIYHQCLVNPTTFTSLYFNIVAKHSKYRVLKWLQVPKQPSVLLLTLRPLHSSTHPYLYLCLLLPPSF